MGWSARDIPVQSGRRAVVTGGTGGLGFEVTAALAAAGCEVVMVGRDAEKAKTAIERMRGRASPELLKFEQADLADPVQVRVLGDRLMDAGGRLDLLINNAGVMALPQREVTEDGVEMQMQVNYLSHFMLTGLLLSRMQRSAGARVVNVSSGAARPIDFADLQSRKYDPFLAYGRSKTAMLMFAFALQRRAVEHGWPVAAYAAHPGWAQTGLMELEAEGAHLPKTLIALATPMFGQSAAEGALPILYAATAPGANPGYFGPTGLGGLRGSPGPAPGPGLYPRQPGAGSAVGPQRRPQRPSLGLTNLPAHGCVCLGGESRHGRQHRVAVAFQFRRADA